MTEYDSFDSALAKQDNYLASLSRSMGLVLDEFYEQVPSCRVSAKLGTGFEQLLEETFPKLKQDYFEGFAAEMLVKQQKKKEGGDIDNDFNMNEQIN